MISFLIQLEFSVGEAAGAMVITGLGLAQQSLYLMPQFFESKPTERLIGEGVEPEHLYVDTLGRALGDLSDYGLTELFRDLATHAAEQPDLTSRFAHQEATSFSFRGEHESEEESAGEVISVQKRNSRDRRPDLNQVVLDLMVEHPAGLPMLMEPLSSNASDEGSFPELIDGHLSDLQHAHEFDYVVVDSALYTGSQRGRN